MIKLFVSTWITAQTFVAVTFNQEEI